LKYACNEYIFQVGESRKEGRIVAGGRRRRKRKRKDEEGGERRKEITW
jgi:hypothetical protein